MIILEFPVSHGPHKWYAATLAMCGFVGIDFLRLADTHVDAERGRYEFKAWESV